MGVAARVPPGAAIIVGLRGRHLVLDAEVGDQFSAGLGFQILQSRQIGEAAHEGVLAPGRHQPLGGFADLALVRPAEVDAPHLVIFTRVDAQQRKRDLQLAGPSIRVHMHGALPDPIPGEVRARVVVERRVPLHAARVDPEAVAAAMVVEAVEVDGEPVRRAVLVSAMDAAHDISAAGCVDHPRADVEVVIVVEDFHFRGPLSRRAIIRPGLAEGADTGRRGPGGVIQAAIQLQLVIHPDGLEAGRGIRLHCRQAQGDRRSREHPQPAESHATPVKNPWNQRGCAGIQIYHACRGMNYPRSWRTPCAAPSPSSSSCSPPS